MHASLAIVAVLLAAANAQLWGVTPENQLVTLDNNTGRWTLAGEAFADRHVTTLIQVADIDESEQTFYIIAVNRSDTTVSMDVIGLSADSGQIIYDVPLPFHFSFNYIDTPGLDYIPGTHDVIVYGPNVDGQTYNILRITASTNTITNITSWPHSNAVIQSVDAYDPVNGILWLQLSQNNMINTLGFNVANGKLVFNTSDSYGMQSMNFDSIKKQTVGLGKPSNGNTPIVAISGVTGEYTQIGSVSGEYIVVGPDNAGLDVTNRLLYQYTDDGTNHALLVVNIDTGATSTVPFTDGASVVPTTIAFFN